MPTLMRMDEFESRAMLLEDRVRVDPMQRILLLREAASSQIMQGLKLEKDLVRFFSRSDALFKFYEELAAEGVSFEMLHQADAYAEFGEHLMVLEALQERYHQLLEARGLTDRAFFPTNYRLNEGFIGNYEQIEIFLEGYLSRFELALLEQIATVTTVVIHYQTSPFNRKMQERFAKLGMRLPANAQVTFDLSRKILLSEVPNTTPIEAEVIAAKERVEQVALAFEAIEVMVQRGIDPEKIALVLPDEAFKKHFMLFDTLHNLNFAMGYDYTDTPHYKSLEALYRYWHRYGKEEERLLVRYGFDVDKLTAYNPRERCGVEVFFQRLEALGFGRPSEGTKVVIEAIEEAYRYFVRLFATESLSLKEWLFLWLKRLATVTIDDVKGGKVTLLGVLETRGVQFDGVVIVDFNEGVVPASSAKDRFLNSQVRAFADLPTRHDRESLQKQYYKRLLEGAKEATILYATADNRLPSKFLFELGLEATVPREAQIGLLYAQPSQLLPLQDPVVEHFDATAHTWSASRLKTFLECKRKYYYRYIAKIEPKQSEELNEGAFLHLLLEHLYAEQAYYDTPEALLKQIDRLLATLLPYDDPHTTYRKLLWRAKLKGFVAEQIAHFETGWRVVEREKEFGGQIGGLRFKGRIDRIDQNETQTLVLDYKSGRVEKEPKKLNPDKITDFQMSIYHQLLQGRYQNIHLAYLKLFEGGEMQEVTLLEERDALLAEHIASLKQTDGFVAQRCDALSRCTYCEFRLMCGRGEYLS